MGWLGWVDGIAEGMIMSPEELRKISLKYMGSTAAADYTSYEGKALASKRIQDRTYAFESLILCNARWPMTQNDGPAIASQILSAVTGKDVDEEKLEKIGERNFNQQRAILLRQGWGGREGDRLLDYHHNEPIQYLRFDRECKVPDEKGEVGSRKGKVIDREEFEKMKSEYYKLRGWDADSGLQTKSKLKELELEDVAADLEGRGLLK
jgi:aldehyde:ferredoxin oxidoreductase